MQMYQVDAFTDQFFTGNPAAVLVVDGCLPDGLVLAIAQQNNLAESAFVKARSHGPWDLRWFAPAHKVDFCVDATLANAHASLAENGDQEPIIFYKRGEELWALRKSIVGIN